MSFGIYVNLEEDELRIALDDVEPQSHVRGCGQRREPVHRRTRFKVDWLGYFQGSLERRKLTLSNMAAGTLHSRSITRANIAMTGTGRRYIRSCRRPTLYRTTDHRPRSYAISSTISARKR